MTKKSVKYRRGRPWRHGGYSIIHRDRAIADHPEIRRYLEACREGLVKDLGGSEDKLSEQQRIMIDRIISRLGICRLIEVYVEKCGLFRRDRLEGEKVLELEPALGVNYLAFSNSIDRALQALGLGKREEADVLDLGRYIQEADAREAAVKANKGTGKAGTKAHGGRGDRQGKGGKGKAMDQGAGEKGDRRASSSDVSGPDGGESQDQGHGQGQDGSGGDDGDDPGGSSKGI